MANFYSNENFRLSVVKILRDFGHDVLTVNEAGNANLSIPDLEVINFAHTHKRIVITFNRKDFIKIHNQNPIHSGIMVCTEDVNNLALAQRIHDALKPFNEDFSNQLIRINRPS